MCRKSQNKVSNETWKEKCLLIFQLHDGYLGQETSGWIVLSYQRENII